MKKNKYKLLSFGAMVGGIILGFIGNFADEKVQDEEITNKINEAIAALVEKKGENE